MTKALNSIRISRALQKFFEKKIEEKENEWCIESSNGKPFIKCEYDTWSLLSKITMWWIDEN